MGLTPDGRPDGRAPVGRAPEGRAPVGLTPDGRPEGGEPELNRVSVLFHCEHVRRLTDERQRAWQGASRRAERAQRHPGGERWQHQRVRREEYRTEEDR